MKVENKFNSWNKVLIEEIFAEQDNGVKLGQGWSPQCLKTPSPSESKWGVLKTTSIQAGYFLDAQNKQLPTTLEPRKHLEVKKGDILITCAGPRNRCGIACLVRKTRSKLMISGKMYRFKVDEKKATPEFIELFLQTREAWVAIDKMKTGGSDSGLNLTHARFKQLEIPIPSVEEQRLIVSKIEQLFSDLDNGKQQLQTALQQLKVYRQSLLKAAFEGKLTPLNRDSLDLHDKHDLNSKSNQGHQGNQKNQGADKGELPEAWKWVKLGEVCKNVEYGSATKSKETGKVPVLRMGNIQKGRFDRNDLVFTDDNEEIKKYLLKNNDILFNRTNSAEWVGKTAIYKGERPAIFAGYLIRINRIEELIDADYLTYYLNTHAAKQYGNTVRSFGVNQSNINGTKLKTYPIPLPNLDEQQLIVQLLESKLTVCDKIEETIIQSLQQAETLRQSILKKAFEGKLVPAPKGRDTITMGVTHREEDATPDKALKGRNNLTRKK